MRTRYIEETDTLVVKLDANLDTITLENASKELNDGIMEALPDNAIRAHYYRFQEEMSKRDLHD